MMGGKHLVRDVGIPQQFPIRCYKPAPSDIPADSPEVIVGLDSGIGNAALAYMELVRDEENALIDFRYGGSYYFQKELSEYSCRLDRQLLLAEHYFDLFSKKRVVSLTFEALFTDPTKDYETQGGVMAAQETTTILSMLAYQLRHSFDIAPATAVKYCLTGYGRAAKNDMCLAAYALTKDAELLSNDHRADAFACALFTFVQKLKKEHICHGTPIPERFAHMDWNFKSVQRQPPASPQRA